METACLSASSSSSRTPFGRTAVRRIPADGGRAGMSGRCTIGDAVATATKADASCPARAGISSCICRSRRSFTQLRNRLAFIPCASARLATDTPGFIALSISRALSAGSKRRFPFEITFTARRPHEPLKLSEVIVSTNSFVDTESDIRSSMNRCRKLSAYELSVTRHHRAPHWRYYYGDQKFSATGIDRRKHDVDLSDVSH
ncbi:Uncharacterised protein [Agrobacterium tumefaciens]|nr:Uncharacterised protein [Agrobacterium tumefaciens]